MGPAPRRVSSEGMACQERPGSRRAHRIASALLMGSPDAQVSRSAGGGHF